MGGVGRAAALVALLGGSLLFVVLAKHVVLPIVIAVLASFLLGPMVRWLTHCRMPRPLAAAAVVFAVLTAAAIGVWTQAAPALLWIERIPQSLPEIERKLSVLRLPLANMTHLFRTIDEATGNAASTSAVQVEVAHGGWPQGLATQLCVFASDVLFATILTFFILLEGASLPRRIANAFSGANVRRNDGYGELGVPRTQVQQLIEESERTIATYLLTVTWINILLGASVGMSCWLLGMPNPVLWGIMAMALNYIPYFGSVVGIGILAVAGLLSFDVIGAGLAPAIAYMVCDFIEGELVTPFALRHQFSLDPVVTVIWTTFWLWLWGIPGGIFAVPLLLITAAICRNVTALRPLSEVISQ